MTALVGAEGVVPKPKIGLAWPTVSTTQNPYHSHVDILGAAPLTPLVFL